MTVEQIREHIKVRIGVLESAGQHTVAFELLALLDWIDADGRAKRETV